MFGFGNSTLTSAEFLKRRLDEIEDAILQRIHDAEDHDRLAADDRAAAAKLELDRNEYQAALKRLKASGGTITLNIEADTSKLDKAVAQAKAYADLINHLNGGIV